MKGLKTQESYKFMCFFEIVQNEAARNGKIFFLDCGEGREFINEKFEGEDLSGWLIPIEKEEVFSEMWKKGKDLSKWADNIVFAVWNMDINGEIKIVFENY
ncbi:MAG: hypothetical protein LUG66_08480 [Clostridiales bacterium]|nr:hypothetical protein [Clostridiales bacterium]